MGDFYGSDLVLGKRKSQAGKAQVALREKQGEWLVQDPEVGMSWQF